MIIEDERDLDAPIEVERETPPPEVQTAENDNIRFEKFLGGFRKIKDKKTHFALRNSLTKLIICEKDTLTVMFKFNVLCFNIM